MSLPLKRTSATKKAVSSWREHWSQRVRASKSMCQTTADRAVPPEASLVNTKKDSTEGESSLLMCIEGSFT